MGDAEALYGAWWPLFILRRPDPAASIAPATSATRDHHTPGCVPVHVIVSVLTRSPPGAATSPSTAAACPDPSPDLAGPHL